MPSSIIQIRHGPQVQCGKIRARLQKPEQSEPAVKQTLRRLSRQDQEVALALMIPADNVPIAQPIAQTPDDPDWT